MSASTQLPTNGAGVTPLEEAEHLLKVAASVCKDAADAWAGVWDELKAAPAAGPSAQAKGFVPRCGWSEFTEKFWLIKYYLDSAQRVCNRHH